MAVIPIIIQSIDEVQFIIDYLSNNIAAYNLHGLTNGNMGDVPNIVGAHPLAMEYGSWLNSDEEGNFSSILPAIGVELISDGEQTGQQFLGNNYKTKEITQDYIDEIDGIAIKDRFSNGIVLSDKNLTEIQSAKTDKGIDKLWSQRYDFLMGQNVNVSVWSDNAQITRILYVVIRSLLLKLKHALSAEGARNASVSGTGAIYNFEFNTTLYGGEFNLTFINNHQNIDVNSDISTFKGIDESVLGEVGKSKAVFVGK